MSAKQILSHSFAISIADLSAKLLPLVTFPLVTRVLGPETYGQLSFAIAIAGFFSLLAAPGFTTYGIREVARAEKALNHLLESILGSRIVFAAGSYVLLALFAFTLVPHEGMTRTLLLLTGLGFVVGSINLQWVYAGQSRMWIIATWGMIAQIIYAAIISTTVRHPSDAWLIPVSTIISALVSAIGLYLIAFKEFKIKWPRLSVREWGPVLPVSLVLGLASMMSMIYDQIDTVMLKYLRTDAEVGLYAASYKIMGIGLSFLPVIGQVFFPLISRSAGKSAADEALQQQWMFTAVISLSLPVTVGGILLAEVLVALLLGPQYGDAVHLVKWLMPNVIAASLASYYCGRLIPYGREKQYLICVAVGALVNIALNALFIPEYGTIAAVIATILSQACVAGMGVMFGRDLVVARIGRPVLVALLATCVMGLALHFMHAYPIHGFGLIVVGMLVYAGSYWLIHSLTGIGLKETRHVLEFNNGQP